MTMTAPAPSDPAGEVTYTPTTHRISKAKKGKKVHVCEVPGCGKVYDIFLISERVSDCMPRCLLERSTASKSYVYTTSLDIGH